MPVRSSRPNVPVPPRNTEDMMRWARDLCVELEIFFSKYDSMMLDNRGFLLSASQFVDADGFTVEAVAPYMDLWSFPGAFTSSPTFAIAMGVENQFMVISNTGGATYTIKNNAQTFLLGSGTGGDVILEPLHSIFLRWDILSNQWIQITMD
jgi:hypothetical protein